MCDPTERIFKAPVACEGLLPNHCRTVTPDDLIATETQGRAAKLNSKTAGACC